MWLIRNGVAEDLAWKMNAVERKARCVVFLQFEGTDWDWGRMVPKERK